MTEDPIDPDRWPGDPPSEVAQPLLWRMGVRLVADHQAQWATPPWQAAPTCRGCGQPWPCLGRRLGERGVLASMSQPELRPAERLLRGVRLRPAAPPPLARPGPGAEPGVAEPGRVAEPGPGAEPGPVAEFRYPWERS